MKISELSKELEVASKDLIALANDNGIECKAATKNLTDEEADTLRKAFSKANKKEEKPAKEVKAAKPAPKEADPKEAVKAEVKEATKEAVKEANKEAPKKPAEAKVNFFVEYGGVQVAIDEVVANVKATYGKDAKEISVYLKPNESKAYFVADGTEGDMDVFFC